MKINSFIFSILVINLSCHRVSEVNVNKRLIQKAIFSDEFTERFRICKKSDEEINIYNDLKENLDFTFQKKNVCGKTINFSEISFDYSVNILENRNKGIVLYKFEKTITFYELSFLELQTNFSYRMKYDCNQKLISTSSGSF